MRSPLPSVSTLAQLWKCPSNRPRRDSSELADAGPGRTTFPWASIHSLSAPRRGSDGGAAAAASAAGSAPTTAPVAAVVAAPAPAAHCPSPEVTRHVRIPTERPARMSVSNRSPTMTMRRRSPEWPCCRSSSMAGSIMYLPPMLTPLPQQKMASLPCGYINLRIISANMPGPGSGNIMPGWLGSTEGLKASSAVYVNCAPCDSSSDAALTTSKLQSEKPPPLISQNSSAPHELRNPHALDFARAGRVGGPLLGLLVGERGADLPRVDERHARRAAARVQVLAPRARASLDDEDARMRRHGGEHEVHLRLCSGEDVGERHGVRAQLVRRGQKLLLHAQRVFGARVRKEDVRRAAVDEPSVKLARTGQQAARLVHGAVEVDEKAVAARGGGLKRPR
eukprot:scaffold81290_cov59-Phaeocystis_antarctica.AAC.8